MAKPTKTIRERHFGKIIGHDDVIEIPAGIRLKVDMVRERPKDKKSDDVLRCSTFDDKDREFSLGDWGGVDNLFNLAPIPQKHRMAVYIAIAHAGDLVGIS
jgi:hypothetical protein